MNTNLTNVHVRWIDLAINRHAHKRDTRGSLPANQEKGAVSYQKPRKKSCQLEETNPGHQQGGPLRSWVGYGHIKEGILLVRIKRRVFSPQPVIPIVHFSPLEGQRWRAGRFSLHCQAPPCLHITNDAVRNHGPFHPHLGYQVTILRLNYLWRNVQAISLGLLPD